jgi:type IV fimbrial biogenesis protein FimT
VLCPSTDGARCIDSPDWSGGWIVFLDPNASRERDAGEPLLLAQPALAGRVRLRSTAGRTRIVFQGNGGNAGSNVTFTLCDGRGPAKARALILSNTGGLRDGAATPDNLAATCVH